MPGEISRTNPGGDGSIPWHVLNEKEQLEAGRIAYHLLHEWRTCGGKKNHKRQADWLAELTQRVDVLLGF